MIIVDRLLEERFRDRRPVTVGILGAGRVAAALMRQIERRVPGLRVVAVAAAGQREARAAVLAAGLPAPRLVLSADDVADAMRDGRTAVAADGVLLARSAGIDVLLLADAPLAVAAEAALEALTHRIHVVSACLELDVTLGPILAGFARRFGAVYTGAGGGQPAALLDLYRTVAGLGVRPILCGTVEEPQAMRRPEPADGVADDAGGNVVHLPSHAARTRVALNLAAIANATGLAVAGGGLRAPQYAADVPLARAMEALDTGRHLAGRRGVVDTVVGTAEAPGVFVLGTHCDPVTGEQLAEYRVGGTMLYLFHRPFRPCPLAATGSIARAALLGDAAAAPGERQRADVVAVASREIGAGELLDDAACHGAATDAATAVAAGLLPWALAGGLRTTRPVARGEAIRRDDVAMPADRPIDRMRAAQDRLLASPPAAAAVPIEQGGGDVA